jgi:hypothetical protein
MTSFDQTPTTLRRRYPARALFTIALIAAIALASLPTASASAATLVPSISPNRLHARVRLTVKVDYGGKGLAIPAPVRHSVLRLPEGLTLYIPHLRSCPIERLRALGPHGCPRQSRLGSGHALVESRTGSQAVTEAVSMWAFLGRPNNLQPTFEILARGYTPTYEQMVLTGTVLPDRPPYGEKLVMSIPPIRTLPLQPDASIISLTLTIGAQTGMRRREANTLSAPSICPTGGFPFAATFTYANGTSDSALATDRCPL